jgi:hypothetical protein
MLHAGGGACCGSTPDAPMPRGPEALRVRRVLPDARRQGALYLRNLCE